MLPCVRCLCVRVCAVDYNLLAPAQYLDLVRAAIGRDKNWRADLAEWFVRPEQHGTLGRPSRAHGTFPYHALDKFLQLVGNAGI